jgi:lipoprotein-anchoring transpeptidase ErfK/SrfK
MPSLSRRTALLGLLAAATQVAPGAWSAVRAAPHPLYGGDSTQLGVRDPELLPPPESPIDFPIEGEDLSEIPQRFHRQMVPYHGFEEAGTIIVDPHERLLYLVMGNGTALRYGVGVGRAGFAWSGEATVGLKRRWPRWVPPEEMIYRDARAAEWANGMPGGPENPLGARALYLHANGQDTLFRIHGTNEPASIGKAMSSGCIRMLNEDVADLYERVPMGAKVIVLSGTI